MREEWSEEGFYCLGEGGGGFPRCTVPTVWKGGVGAVGKKGGTVLGEGGEFRVICSGDPEEWGGDFFKEGAEVFLGPE